MAGSVNNSVNNSVKNKINKLMIANRGEIAVRVIRTATRMGIPTLAIYSEADAGALHVEMADAACLIGPPPPLESYLDINRIFAVAKEQNVDAIHPCYGFLSENPDFAQACQDNGLIFVGPSPASIRTMGLKSQARQLARKAGVPLLDGMDAVDLDDKNCRKQIEAIGFPVLLKPSAGGGGKGMRVVRSNDELAEAVGSAQREALNAFGNDHLILEQFIEAPRHIEIQVFGDSLGNVVYLNERDCSLQRRHQKIIEESPAPHFSPELRRAMGESACLLANEIGYEGAGTVEYLLDAKGEFYFMEMNTRLQVEHPVTEMTTGLDLVEWQLRVAMGEALPLSQDQISLKGHAMEARLYAEDPANQFLPASGKISQLRLPEASAEVRIDNGVRLNDLVGVYYDPMMMKLIAWGDDREAARLALLQALGNVEIGGVTSNRDFLIQMLDQPVFADGEVTTDYIDRHADIVNPPMDETELHLFLCGALCYLMAQNGSEIDLCSPWESLKGFRLNGVSGQRLKLGFKGKEFELLLAAGSVGGHVDVAIDAQNYCIERVSNNASTAGFNWKNQRYHFSVCLCGRDLWLFSQRRTLVFNLGEDYDLLAEQQVGGLQAPMSGRIVSVLVKIGDHVSKDQPLVIMEAMKMEHTIKAPEDGIVSAVHFVEGDLVDEGLALISFEDG